MQNFLFTVFVSSIDWLYQRIFVMIQNLNGFGYLSNNTGVTKLTLLSVVWADSITAHNKVNELLDDVEDILK